MNRNRDYELHCLLELIAAGINKEAIPVWSREPDWNTLYKLADYHHVANTVYGMILGMDSKRLTKWKSSFEERFRYCVVMHPRYREAEKEILNAMERARIHCMELEETVISGCYERKELHYPMPLGFLVEPGKADQVIQVMSRIGFELKGPGESPANAAKLTEQRFHKATGVSVVFYEKLTFTGKKIGKYFSLPPQPFQKKKGRSYNHVQDINDFYLYYIALLAEKYARGTVEIRDMLDLWQYYLLCYERMEWKTIYKELKRLEIDQFGDLIVKLAAMWFGQLEELEDDSGLLPAMERYIASKGTEAREENEALLPLVKEVADVYERDLKKEMRKKQLEMWFPERSYMEAIYPVLSKTGILLPFCWMARLAGRQLRKVRYFFRRKWGAVREAAKKVTAKLQRIKASVKNIKERFAKRKEDENNP